MTVQSVERAFAILETFDERHPSRGAAEIASAAQLPRPTTYRMLATLVQMGYVRNVAGRFEVTPRVLRLGAGYIGRDSLAARSQATLDQLSETIGEHVALGVLDGDEVITLAAANSPQSRFLSVAVQVGQRLPADTTSLGRVLTAYLPGADDAEAIGARDNGYVLTDGLLETGLRSIGVPVRDHAGDVIASIAVAVNAVRVSNEHLVEHCLPHLRTAADHLSTLV